MSTRETIVSAAAKVMREKGLALATTKAIAREAGFSEAMLYKHFADKQELFLVVLKERLPAVTIAADLAGTGEVRENLERVAEQFMAFFVLSFPMAASTFGSPDLLRKHREGAINRGYGPYAPKRMVRGYLDAEQRLGRIAEGADLEGAETALVGGAFHLAFLAAFEGFEKVPEANRKARGLVGSVMPALQPGR
jgi:AcrR family transcriptional regulator